MPDIAYDCIHNACKLLVDLGTQDRKVIRRLALTPDGTADTIVLDRDHIYYNPEWVLNTSCKQIAANVSLAITNAGMSPVNPWGKFV